MAHTDTTDTTDTTTGGAVCVDKTPAGTVLVRRVRANEVKSLELTRGEASRALVALCDLLGMKHPDPRMLPHPCDSCLTTVPHADLTKVELPDGDLGLVCTNCR